MDGRASEEELTKRVQELEKALFDRQGTEELLRLANQKLEALWSVASLASADVKAVSDHVLAKITGMTNSAYGFYGFVDEDASDMEIHSWSREAMTDCAVEDKPRHFPIEKAGVWAEAIRRREALILNNYDAEHDAKKGIPEGHVRIENLLVVPYTRGNRIVSVAAVANKPTDYDRSDIAQLESFLLNIQVLADSKKAEDALRESEERYRELIEKMLNGFALHEIISDDEGNPSDYRFLEVNTAFERMTGLRADRIVGRTVLEVLPDTEAYWIETYGKVALTGESIQYENYSQEFDRHFEALAYSPKPGQFATIFTDVTERKRAEKSLTFTQFAVDRSSDAAFWMGEDARFIYVNDQACRSLGYSREELLGMTVHDIGPEFPAEVWPDHWEDLRQRGSFILETVHRRKDGSDFPVEIVVNYVKFGEVEYNCAFARDITKRKQAVEERNALRDSLQEAQKMEAIANLAGGIAHQFNNALAPILAGIDLIEMDLPKTHDITQYARPMRDSAHRMSSLTNQLLAYAQGGKYRAGPLRLDTFIRETLPLIQHTLKPSVVVETDLPSGIMGIHADATQMQMVLSATLSNASEAIEDRGRIHISCRNLSIENGAEIGDASLASGAYVHLKIQDDGRGMDDDTLSQVFDPFFTTGFAGRGLGMAAVHGIVLNHAGSVRIESVLGRGTTVHVYLPVWEPDAAEEGKDNASVVSAFSSVTVLVIEDDDAVLELTAAILEKIGCSVLQATTAAEALAIIRTFAEEIDVILLDIKLPDMDGDRLYPLIVSERPDQKVIVCSGYAVDGPAQSILDAGAEGFLQKPFSLRSLQIKIGEVLET